jgi:negative regulator of sigma-B (phosphoserine phosphatase)
MVSVKADTVTRPKMGETISGDRVGIWQDQTATLATVIDGLGSGQAASEAAQKALTCVEDNRDQPVTEIMLRCHETVRETRGVVMALLRIEHDQNLLTFVGVGNIGFCAASAEPMRPISKNGIVGHRLPELLEFHFQCSPGDRIILYSDGISSQFLREGGARLLSRMSSEREAQHLVERFGQTNDDAAVAILKVMGNHSALP